MFKRIAESNNLEGFPRIIWPEIALEELDSKAKRLGIYAKAGMPMNTKNTIKHIRELEGLPTEEEDLEPVPSMAQKKGPNNGIEPEEER